MYVRQRKTIRKVKIFHIPNHKMHSTGRDLRVEAVRCQTTKGLIIFINFKRDDKYAKMSNFVGLDFFYVFAGLMLERVRHIRCSITARMAAVPEIYSHHRRHAHKPTIKARKRLITLSGRQDAINCGR